MKTPVTTAAAAAQTAQTSETTPQIVPNTPEMAQNPVPATERDTPVLIQYSAPEPAVAAPGPIATAASTASETVASTTAVVEKAVDLLQAVAAVSGELVAGGTFTTVKMLRNHPKVGAFKGTVTKLPAHLAADLIAAEFAVAATDEDGTPETSGFTETK